MNIKENINNKLTENFPYFLEGEILNFFEDLKGYEEEVENISEKII